MDFPEPSFLPRHMAANSLEIVIAYFLHDASISQVLWWTPADSMYYLRSVFSKCGRLLTHFSFVLPKNPTRFPYFIGEETEAQRLSNLPKVIWLVSPESLGAERTLT